MAYERRLYSTTSTFKLNDNNLMLVRTAVDPNERYRFSFFSSELKEKVEKLLKMEVKKYSRREAQQRNDSPTYQPLKSLKPQSSTNFDSKNYS